ncbi:MAG: DUF4383 domain-containing protein [Actinomycetota bacterium]|nr:DUF4383 domain-containing protein [Actinomycetota bacterium]
MTKAHGSVISFGTKNDHSNDDSIESKESKPRWIPAQRFALIFGITYLASAIAGYYIIGIKQYPLVPNGVLMIFGMNPLHISVHFVVGLVWIASSFSKRYVIWVNITFGIVFGLLTVFGLLNLLPFLGVTGLADPDNYLHLFTGILGLFYGTVGANGSSDLDRQDEAAFEEHSADSWK